MAQIGWPGILPPKDYHDFRERLEYADANSKLLQLEVFYKSCFPGISKIEKVQDRVLQRQGIDTILILENGKRVYFDEKIREIDYGDILLEEFSVWHDYPFINGVEIGNFEFPTGWSSYGLKPGWLSGQKRTDYISYIVKPSKKVYFLPFLLLQRAWKDNYMNWLQNYGRKVAENETYVTTNIPVPTEELYQAIFACAKWNV